MTPDNTAIPTPVQHVNAQHPAGTGLLAGRSTSRIGYVALRT